MSWNSKEENEIIVLKSTS